MQNDMDIISDELWVFDRCNDEDAERITGVRLTYGQDVWHRLRKNKLAMTGLAIITLLILIAVFGSLFLPYTYYDQDLTQANIPPLLKMTEVSPGKYIYVTQSLKVFVAEGNERKLIPLKKVSDDFVKKQIEYSLEGNTFFLDYSSLPLKLLKQDTTPLAAARTFWNKSHILGTDALGRDLLARLIFGAQISLTVAFIAAFVNLIIGMLYGGVSGYLGGTADIIMMRIVDIISTIPLMLYVILIMVLLNSGFLSIVIALGLVYWVDMARIVRGQILSLKNMEFVLAAETIGTSAKDILLRHLLPNAMGPIIVAMMMLIPNAIFIEAFMSFIGLGVAAPYASWGTLCNDALEALRSHPYQLFLPAAAICITMFAFNFLGDGLRDSLDPKLRK